jgi:hypothetical protein
MDSQTRRVPVVRAGDRASPNLATDSSSAAESIARSLERLDQLFLWGHWTAEKYQAERERLEACARS